MTNQGKLSKLTAEKSQIGIKTSSIKNEEAGVNRVVVLTFLMFGFVGCNRSSSNNASLSISEINDRQVVGYLGLPLTETTMLHATIVDGATLGEKRYTSSYLLSVTSVNGVPLASDHLFRFMVPLPNEPDDDFGLVSGRWGFSELPNRMNGNRFPEEKINELRASYAGTKLLLKAYEVGSFYRHCC